MKIIKQIVRKILKKFNIEINFISHKIPSSMDSIFQLFYDEVRPYTKTNMETLYSLYETVKHIVKTDIKGDFVECGVWKGGCCMLMALSTNIHKIWLYDTFEGVSTPCDLDVRNDGVTAKEKIKKHGVWCPASYEEVKDNMEMTHIPEFEIVKGDVTKSLNKKYPEKIALLRLDMDIYKPTLFALEKLYPKLVKGGILIIDDYDDWNGVKKAVDGYFKNNNIKILLHRISGGCRVGIKQ